MMELDSVIAYDLIVVHSSFYVLELVIVDVLMDLVIQIDVNDHFVLLMNFVGDVVVDGMVWVIGIDFWMIMWVLINAVRLVAVVVVVAAVDVHYCM